ncbi:MFS transporter [Methanocella sp. CWC-04]|uniref:MFS transporter n=1 Tax=Methanooceanicella nereidis TaxID=2052831 RepID=A0AAP2RBR0_9EURY|nr:MFS transporter [Methanocella sp. CWC-04]MCD1294589.1 MFS transporter [Methanocella sp. CWC-04]
MSKTSKDDNERSRFDKFRVFLLGLGHFTVDVYANMLPPLLPIFKQLYGLSYAATAGLTSIFSITSTLIQPIFGYLADRYGKKWIAAFGVAWCAVLMCCLGIAPNYASIVVLVALAGLGSSMFHPQASAMVPKVSGDRKGFGVAIFSAGGSIGYSIMPLIAVIIVGMFGIESLVWLMGPGIIVALLMYIYSPDMEEECKDPSKIINLGTLAKSMREVLGPLTTLITVVSLRNWVTIGMITFIPLFYAGRFAGWEVAGYDVTYLAPAITLFLFIFSNAIGGIVGGWASDRYGKKNVLVSSLFASVPFFYLAFNCPDILVWPFMAIAGGLIYASFSPMMLQAQELLPKSQGMAGGLILGFSNGIGGLLVLLTGVISDHSDVYAGVMSLIVILVLTGFMALLLPGDRILKTEVSYPVAGQTPR